MISFIKKPILSVLRYTEDSLHRLLRGTTRKILIDGGSLMHFDQFRALAPALAADPRIKVYLTSSWGDDMTDKDVRAVAQSFGFSAKQYVKYKRAKWMKWDIYLESCFDNPWFMWKCPRAEVFHGISEKYIPDEDRVYMIHPLAKTCDHLFCPNQRVVDGFKDHPEFLKPSTELHLTGMSRQDWLEWGMNSEKLRSSIPESLGMDSSRKTILFAPTYGEGGLLHERGIEVLHQLVSCDRYNIIVKLHPCSLMTGNYSWALGMDWVRELSAFSENSHFIHLISEDISKLMCAADVLVGDFSSTTLDFATAGMPTYFYMSEHQHKNLNGHDEQWNMLQSAAQCFDGDSDVSDVFSVGFHDVEASEERSAAVEYLREQLHPFMGHATERVLAAIYDIIDIDVPEDIHENSEVSLSQLFL